MMLEPWEVCVFFLGSYFIPTQNNKKKGKAAQAGFLGTLTSQATAEQKQAKLFCHTNSPPSKPSSGSHRSFGH